MDYTIHINVRLPEATDLDPDVLWDAIESVVQDEMPFVVEGVGTDANGWIATLGIQCSDLPSVESVAELVEASSKKAGLPKGQISKIGILDEGQLDSEHEAGAFPDLVGVSEIGDILGVSRQRASELTRHKGFPEPVASLKAGPVWTAWVVKDWNENRRKLRGGRPPKSNSRSLVRAVG